MSSALKPPDPMTVAEFLAWDAPGPTHWELVDGVPVALSPGSRTHNELLGELGALVLNRLVETGRPC